MPYELTPLGTARNSVPYRDFRYVL